MKIGIYTIHTPNNYGAMLQAYATQKALDKIGITSELVNLYPIKSEKNNKYLCSNNSIKNIIKNIYAVCNPKVHLKSKRFADFHNSMRLSKRYYTIDEIYANPPQYDIHLTGSDQVWNLEKGLNRKSPYYLDFLPYEANRMSYAASTGSAIAQDIDAKTLFQLLSRFRHISVREYEGAELIKKYTGIDADIVMDPTFLLTQKEWSKLSGEKPIINGDYILAYGFSQKEETNQLIAHIKRRLGLPVIGISVSLHHPFNYDLFMQEVGPIEFLNLIRYAKFVITASFHGAAFAIHFKKDFWVSKHPTRNSRITTMLTQTGLTDRMIDLSQKDSYNTKNLPIDYQIVTNQIEEISTQSFNWLKKSILSF